MATAARAALPRGRKRKTPEPGSDEALAKLQRRLQQIEQRDRFAAAGREAAAAALIEVERRTGDRAGSRIGKRRALPPQGSRWVTRRGLHVDRMASAWLIRRWLDPRARFKFVDSNYAPARGEVRFDMFEAEFTHSGGNCTFEVLVDAGALRDPALTRVGQIIHELDVKDGRYQRPETAGVGALLDAIAQSPIDDDERLRRSAALFDGLYDSLRGVAYDRRKQQG